MSGKIKMSLQFESCFHKLSESCTIIAMLSRMMSMIVECLLFANSAGAADEPNGDARPQQASHHILVAAYSWRLHRIQI